SYPQGSGQNFRAVSANGYVGGATGVGAIAAGQVSVGVIPQGTSIGSVPVGAEVIGSPSVSQGAPVSPWAGVGGVHGWLSPGRLNISLYAQGGGAGGQSPPEYPGVNRVFQGSAGVEYLAGGESRDTPRVTIGGAFLYGRQSRVQVGDPSGSSTYIG